MDMVSVSVFTEYRDAEGMAVMILEATASGKPIVVSNVSGIPDAVEDGVHGCFVEQKPRNIRRKKFRIQ